MTEELKPFPFALPAAPGDAIFKNRGHREVPANSQWDAGAWDYIPQRFEGVRKTENGYLWVITKPEGEEKIQLTEQEFKEKGLKVGTFAYYYGCPFPRKCSTTTYQIQASIPPKRRFIDAIRLLTSKELIPSLLALGLIGKKRRLKLLEEELDRFNIEADLVLNQFYLNGCYSNVVREIQTFVRVFLTSFGVREAIAEKTGEIIGLFFEFDNAYRYRVNDVLNEASKKELLSHFPQEAMRLVRLEKERDLSSQRSVNTRSDVAQKFEKAARLLKIAWHFPKLRKALKNAINAMNWENVRLDASDVFYTLLYADYDTLGISLGDRTKIYTHLYAADVSKAPPRVMVRNKQ